LRRKTEEIFPANGCKELMAKVYEAAYHPKSAVASNSLDIDGKAYLDHEQMDSIRSWSRAPYSTDDAIVESNQ
jgi:hypothetical protein